MRSWFVTVLICSLREVNADGTTGCPCKAVPTGAALTALQTATKAASNKPTFVTGTSYGYGCKKHDSTTANLYPKSATAEAGSEGAVTKENQCIAAKAGADTTGDGLANDWCEDAWCIVDPDNCDLTSREVTFTAATDDYFSYATCETATATGDFAGNGWVGRVSCRDNPKSFCMAAENGPSAYAPTSTSVGCPCVTSKRTQKAATGKPTFVGGTTYGYGCKKHDSTTAGPGYPLANEPVSNAAVTVVNGCIAAKASPDTTGAGQANDWCEDEWCIIDPKKCNLNDREVSFSSDLNDFFSYKACDPSFAGNGWVGREPCVDSFQQSLVETDNAKKKAASRFDSSGFCSGPENTALKGSTTCPCVSPAKKQKAAAGKPDFVTGTQYGYFCKAHDNPLTWNNEPASPTNKNSCETATDTADGQDNDWCLDKWCIVDPNNCDLKAREVTYSEATGDFFSYKACDADFKGNGWVGRVACKDKPNSFCMETTKAPTTADSPAGTTRMSWVVLLAMAMVMALARC